MSTDFFINTHMNKFSNLSLLLLAAASIPAVADDEIVTLDLTNPKTELKFNESNGAWTETYNPDIDVVESQVFCFMHYGYEQYGMWWGFTPSNSVDNSRKDDTVTYQFSNMALGGIVLNEDGSVKTDEFGDPVTSADVPYLVGYYASFMSEHPCDLVFADGQAWEPQGVYVNLTSYPYYCMEFGDAYARAFRNGDSFKLSIVGVAPDASTKTVETELASFSNGRLSIARGWHYVDLSSLGAVNEIYFNLSTTDVGQWGDNTPEYFALDKLSVKKSDSAVQSASDCCNISFDRASSVISAPGAGFVAVYNAAGSLVASSEEDSICIASLDAGVYVAKAGNSSIKIAK